MARPPWLPAVVLAAVVVVAGCAGPAGAPSPSPSPAPTRTSPATTDAGSPTASPGTTTPTTLDRTTATARETTTATTRGTATTSTTTSSDGAVGRVRVENGTLPVNATLVFRRVLDLLDADAEPPVVRLNPPGYTGGDPEPDPFERRVGLARPEGASLDLPFRAGGSADTVILLFRNTSVEDVPAADIELALAHEFVHVVQDQRGAGRSLVDADLDRDVVTALVEGGAVFVTDAYARRYGLTWSDGRPPIEHRAHDFRTRPAWSLPITGEYYFGARYLDRRLDDPADLWAAYADPPSTMEAVIHGPDVGGPRALQVRVDAPDWTVTRRGPQGELVLRAALRSELSREEAAAAAAGWGNDTVVEFEAGDDTGFAWVTRWDDAGEADEAEAALRRFAERRRKAVGGSFAVVRAAPESVVLLAGPTAFVRAADVRAIGETVTVTVDDG